MRHPKNVCDLAPLLVMVLERLFDNYIKHIKTVLITVKNSILIGNADVFQLNAFSYGDVN